MGKSMIRKAHISECGRYRYSLDRIWDTERAMVAFLMLNPSTADHEVDDPTIRRCISFACSWGFGALRVVNLLPIRATDPRECYERRNEVSGWVYRRNRLSIREAYRDAGLVIEAYGCQKRRGEHWATPNTWFLFEPWDSDAEKNRVLALTKDRCPRHPLYLKGDLVPREWAEVDRVREFPR